MTAIYPGFARKPAAIVNPDGTVDFLSNADYHRYQADAAREWLAELANAMGAELTWPPAEVQS